MWAGISFIGGGAAVFGSDGYFAVECPPQAEVPHQWSHRVADQLGGGETGAGKRWSRPKGPERQSRGTRRSNMVGIEIISELSCSAGDLGRRRGGHFYNTRRSEGTIGRCERKVEEVEKQRAVPVFIAWESGWWCDGQAPCPRPTRKGPRLTGRRLFINCIW